MICPRCQHEQSCPCEACQEREPTEKPWVWINGETIACGGCGHTNSADWWLMEEYKQVTKRGKYGKE